MIVVIGSPIFQVVGAGSKQVAGLAGRVALAAGVAGRTVQLVGKVGDDSAGDALLIALAGGRVGHATMLRDVVHATPVAPALEAAEETADDLALVDDPADEPPVAIPAGLPLEAADLELALRYLTDFAVVVIATRLDPAALATTMDAAGFAGAHVIRLDAPDDHPVGGAPPGVDITAFEAPPGAEPAFADMVGRYAAGLDVGLAPRDAFADATRGTSWERAAAD